MEGVYAKYGWVTYTCGLGYFGEFKDQSFYTVDNLESIARTHGSFEKWAQAEFNYNLQKMESQGTGYVTVGFINTPICKKMREWLDARYKMVFESEKRMNVNSDNEFWFVIYDAKVKLNGNS